MADSPSRYTVGTRDLLNVEGESHAPTLRDESKVHVLLS
jgi:hypothetical protein